MSFFTYHERAFSDSITGSLSRVIADSSGIDSRDDIAASSNAGNDMGILAGNEKENGLPPSLHLSVHSDGAVSPNELNVLMSPPYSIAVSPVARSNASESMLFTVPGIFTVLPCDEWPPSMNAGPIDTTGTP